MLGLISLNYKIAPVKIRELFYIYPEEYQKIFNEINERGFIYQDTEIDNLDQILSKNKIV